MIRCLIYKPQNTSASSIGCCSVAGSLEEWFVIVCDPKSHTSILISGLCWRGAPALVMLSGLFQVSLYALSDCLGPKVLVNTPKQPLNLKQPQGRSKQSLSGMICSSRIRVQYWCAHERFLSSVFALSIEASIITRFWKVPVNCPLFSTLGTLFLNGDFSVF